MPGDDIHPIDPSVHPSLAPPGVVRERRVDREQQVYEASHTEARTGRSTLSSRASWIKGKALAPCKDEELMLRVVIFFNVASRTCAVAGSRAAPAIPFLNVASAPFYLYHACSGAHKRLKLMVTAARVSKLRQALYWLFAAASQVGFAINLVAKSLSGALVVLKVKMSEAVSMIFTMVLPVVMGVFAAMGIISKSWALWKNTQALKRFKEKRDQGDLVALLTYLQGPKQKVYEENCDSSVVAKRYFKLARAEFDASHFASKAAKKNISARIEELLASHKIDELPQKDDLAPLLESMRFAMQDPDCLSEGKEVGRLLEQVEELFGKLSSSRGRATFAEVDETLALYDETITLFYRYGISCAELGPAIDELRTMRGNLAEIKDVVDMSHAEMHRRICKNAIYLLVAVLTLASSVTLLVSPNHLATSYALGITGSTLMILWFVFDRSVSQEKFMAMDRYFNRLSESI